MFEGLLGLLAFFTTLLATGAGIVLVLVFLSTRRPARAWSSARLLLLWLGAYAALLLAVSFTSQPRYLNPGQERCFDEMCYSLQAVTRSTVIETASGPLAPQGIFYVVTVQLHSTARGTAQRPSEPALFVVDASGRAYRPMVNAGNEPVYPAGQPVIARQLWDRPVQPGETLTRTVAFDLPVGIDRPGLVFSEGIGPLAAILIGDESSLFHAKTEYLLADFLK